MKSLEDLWSHLINCLAGVDWPFSLHTLDYILCSISGAWPPQRWSSLLSPVFTQFPSSHPGHQHTLCHTRLVISWHLIEENKFFFALLTSLHSWKLWLQWLLWSLGGDVTIKWQDSVICSVTAEYLQLQCEDISFCHTYLLLQTTSLPGYIRAFCPPISIYYDLTQLWWWVVLDMNSQNEKHKSYQQLSTSQHR